MSCCPTLSTHINSYSSFKLTAVFHSLFKCNSFCLSESTIPYCFFPSIISFHSVKSRKCFLVFLLLLSGDIQLNPGPALFINVNATSPLDVFEPFSSPTLNYVLPLIMLGLCPIAVICDYIIENKLDVLCISETWINDGEMTNSGLSSLPPKHCLSQYYGRLQLSRDGGVAIINHNSIHHTAISILSFSSFECIGSAITSSSSSFKLFVVYRPPSSPSTNFFTEFESLLELQIASNIDLFFIEDFNI